MDAPTTQTPPTGLTDADVSTRVARGQTNATGERTSRSFAEILRANVFTRFNLILGVLLAAIFVVGQLGDALAGAGDERGDVAREQVERTPERHRQGARHEHDATSAHIGLAPGQRTADHRRHGEGSDHDADGEIAGAERPAYKAREHGQRRTDGQEREQGGYEDAGRRGDSRVARGQPPPPEPGRRDDRLRSAHPSAASATGTAAS